MKLTDGPGKEKVQNALLDLIAEHSLESISVKDICQKAGISRGLFYVYYPGKYELLEEIESDLIDGFLELMLEIRRGGKEQFHRSMENRDSSYFIKYFEYIRLHSREFSALLCSKYPNGFSVRFTRAVTKTRIKTREIWRSRPAADNKALILREEFLSALYISMFTSWLNSGMQISVENLSLLLIDLWQAMSNFEHNYKEAAH